MSKATALDRVRRYLERSHATNFNTIPVILGSGENKPLEKATRKIPVVFTAAGNNGFYRPEFITDVLQPDPSMDMLRRPNHPAPRMQLNRIKTGGEPIPFDDIEGFSKFRPYWRWLEGEK